MKYKIKKRFIFLLLFFIIFFITAKQSGLIDQINHSYLKNLILENKTWGGLLFTGLFLVGNLLHIPGWVFLIGAVLAVGKFYGGMITFLASGFSCLLVFVIVRSIGGNALREIDNKLLMKMFGQLDDYPLRSMIVIRTFFQTAPWVNYALALSGIPFRHYFVGTIIGLPLPIILYCLFFDHLLKMMGVPSP